MAGIAIGNERAGNGVAAVLFADMVGFTAISERLAPEALVGLLREFLGRLARIAFQHGGTVDKYIGDAIMVHFGTPRPQPDDPARALACAAAMIEEMRRWNAERGCGGEALLAPLRPDQARTVRGRREPVAIWRLAAAENVESVPQPA